MERGTVGVAFDGACWCWRRIFTNDEELEALMRASHSLKGAARMVDVEPVVQIAHVMEEFLSPHSIRRSSSPVPLSMCCCVRRI